MSTDGLEVRLLQGQVTPRAGRIPSYIQRRGGERLRRAEQTEEVEETLQQEINLFSNEMVQVSLLAGNTSP